MAKKRTVSLNRSPIKLPPPNLGKFTIGEAWMYEEPKGLVVCLELPAVGTMVQRIPVKAILGYAKRYRATKTSRARACSK